jgi:hypothetical protein
MDIKSVISYLKKKPIQNIGLFISLYFVSYFL